MNKLHAILVLVFFLSSAAVFAESDTHTGTALDNELPGGMTVLETLEEWDNSAMRYHNEAPEFDIEEALSSMSQETDSEDTREQS